MSSPEARGLDPENGEPARWAADRGPTERSALIEREHFANQLRSADAEATRDHAERVDPDTSRMVQARDFQAAGGRFDDADSTQALIDTIRAQGATRDRADLTGDRYRTPGRDYPGITRGRGR